MVRTNMTEPTEIHQVVDKLGNFSVLEYRKDVSIPPECAVEAYFAAEMNVRKRQVIIDLDNEGVILQSGAMQMLLGDIQVSTNVKGAGDLFKKFVGSKVTGESTIKPHYHGKGQIILEPSYRYIIFENPGEWKGGMVVEDGLFLGCTDSIDLKVTARKNVSSAVLGGEGLFSTMLVGEGVVVLESPVPKQELVLLELENDTVRLNGGMALAWSEDLQFTVERTTNTLVGSAASGEGLLDTFRGTGRILVAPVAHNRHIATPKH